MSRLKVIEIDEKRKFSNTVRTNDDKRREGDRSMSDDKYITREEFSKSEDIFELKIKVAVQPLESKIDNLSTQINNLPTQFENMLLKERQYQDDKRKETQRYILGTIIIGLAGILASVILHFL